MPWAVAAAVVGGVASNAAAKKGAKAMDRATDANRYQGEIAMEQWEQYKSTYQPLEMEMVQQAKDFDTPFARDQAAGEAQATVAEQFGKARDRLSRTPGLDPSSAAYAASLSKLETSQAAVDATSQNAARRGLKDMAWARKTDALGLGKGLVANATTGMANATNGAAAIAAGQSRNASSTAANIGTLAGNIFSSQGFQNWVNTPSVQPVAQQPGVTDWVSQG